ncbi:MAG TPA: hypothetical protein VFB08_20900 [Burkholderiales bacterium]|nr:hypothetical protein [Burkholderiales bacterium]
MDANIGRVRTHLAALQDLVRRHSGSGPDWRALRRVVALCQEASDAIEDDYCRAKLHVVSEYCAELFSSAEHGRWRRDSMSGAVFLTLQILNALELCNSRLYSLEALRVAGRLGTHSGVAPYHEMRT